MKAREQKRSAAELLRASPNFALTFNFDGRAYVAKDSEPYVQYWLTERYRILLSIFSSRRGASPADAIEGYFRLTRAARTKAERQRLVRAIEDMRSAGVLVGSRDDVSRYDARMVPDYLTHRPFPPEISDFIIRTAPVVQTSRVLDLAGGPGELALALARASQNVSLMELSRGFLNSARTRAKRLGLNFTALHDSCNRLVFREDPYDVITVSQALHWLDDVMVCRGICRVLQPGGSFIVVHVAFDVADSHPLSFLLGNKSILGDKDRRPFADEVRPLLRRLALLFEALDTPDVDRIDLARQSANDPAVANQRIAPAGVSFFQQRRPMGLGFARAFLTPRHIEATGKTEGDFWKDVEARCAGATPEQIAGTIDWAALHFRRDVAHTELPALESNKITVIGYNGPPEG
jgi:2-polyprenyl-3-methyl-5-hydroxy-6-metoxy-1,4-benzoquinol methylase